MPGHFDVSAIRRYYDRHTPAFVRFGQEGSAGSIHRAVWGPGTATRSQAFHWVEDRIAETLDTDLRRPQEDRAPHVLDLGCGVGASLCYLAKRRSIRGTGVTLSPLQVRLATERIRTAGLASRVTCLEGDYGDLPSDLAPADLAFAIESFVHAPDPARFFAQCHRVLRSDATLVICDDFRRPEVPREAVSAIEQFRKGWQVNTLLTPEAIQAVARAAGFVHEETTDLSAYLELGRPRDRAVGALLAIAGWLPLARFDYLRGGHALQRCLAHGWIGYDFVRFRRQP